MGKEESKRIIKLSNLRSVSGYLADGGDGFVVLTEGRVVNADLTFQDALYDQFKEVRNIKKPAINRQIDISKR